jgi:16S rRNA (cytidine1402-2'-O)-methyltransferase
MGNKMEFDTEVQFFELDKHKMSVEELYNFLNTQIKAGKNIGLLSEAGNPCIADPGATAVDLAHQLGIMVKPLVGPSSILLALIASGLNGQHFTFHGYLPIDDKDKRAALKKLESTSKQSGYTQIFMETPYRNDKLVDEMIHSLQPETKLCIAVEIGESNEFIETRSIKNWKQRPTFHKRPAVFVLGN